MVRWLTWVAMAIALLLVNDIILLKVVVRQWRGTVVATVKLAPIPGQHLQVGINRPAQTFDHIVYSDVHCSADWDQDCIDEVPIDTVAGYQICKPVYQESHGGVSRGFFFFLMEPFNDGVTPSKYKRLILHLEAHGSHHWVDQTGSNQNFSNLGASLISDFATEDERRAAGCMFR